MAHRANQPPSVKNGVVKEKVRHFRIIQTKIFVLFSPVGLQTVQSQQQLFKCGEFTFFSSRVARWSVIRCSRISCLPSVRPDIRALPYVGFCHSSFFPPISVFHHRLDSQTYNGSGEEKERPAYIFNGGLLYFNEPSFSLP